MSIPPPSTLSEFGLYLAHFLFEEFNKDLRVEIGPPAEVAQGEAQSEQLLNLFFYLVETSGFFPHTGPHDPLFMRIRCLITAFGAPDTSESTSAGEMDLRILGTVLRIFHENPVLRPGKLGEMPISLETVLRKTEMEEINQIWATQGEIPYRPSVVYEFALTPIVPSRPKPEQWRVASLGIGVQPNTEATNEPFDGITTGLPVEFQIINTSAVDWAPTVCFVNDDECVASLNFSTASGNTVNVWVAGKSGDEVEFMWEVWGNRGWEILKAATTVTTVPAQDSDNGMSSETLDPARGADAVTVSLAVPESGNSQFTLYAQRSFLRTSDVARLGSSPTSAQLADAAVTVRSNPLLVTMKVQE